MLRVCRAVQADRSSWVKLQSLQCKCCSSLRLSKNTRVSSGLLEHRSSRNLTHAVKSRAVRWLLVHVNVSRAVHMETSSSASLLFLHSKTCNAVSPDRLRCVAMPLMTLSTFREVNEGMSSCSTQKLSVSVSEVRCGRSLDKKKRLVSMSKPLSSYETETASRQGSLQKKRSTSRCLWEGNATDFRKLLLILCKRLQVQRSAWAEFVWGWERWPVTSRLPANMAATSQDDMIV